MTKRMKKIMYLTGGMTSLFSASSFAQNNTELVNAGSKFPEWASDPFVYVIGFLFLIMGLTIYILYKANVTLVKILYPDRFKEAETSKPHERTLKKSSLLRRIYLKMVDSVPVEKEKDVLLDHDYDGIKELDNNLPPWWIYGFYFTIFFAVCYMFIYHVTGTGNLQIEEYKHELAVASNEREERIKSNSAYVNEDNVTILTDLNAISKGKEDFNKYCVACHRIDGGGLVGPNLTDEYWIHGGGVKNIFSTITYGVPNQGMISWKSQLSPVQIQQVSSYVLSLQGSNPKAPKEPQGEKWVENVQDSSSLIKTDSLSLQGHEASRGI